MNRRIATRSTLVTLGLATLAACVVNLSFAMDKPGIVLQSTPGQSTLNAHVEQVRLSDYAEINDHKASIKSLDLDYVDVTITALGAGNTAHAVSGSVSLRKNAGDPPANDIKVGDLTNFPLQVGKTTRINGNPNLDAFLLEQLQTAGTFYVVVGGSIDGGVADVTLDLNIHASMGYDTGIL
jgi:hypothetical protein